MDLFENSGQDKPPRLNNVKADNQPLATRMRPLNLEDFSGQEHLVGPDKLLRRAIESGRISSMIFYGPPVLAKQHWPLLSPGR
jgi:replication-associated recombination protein RarA